MLTAFLRRLWLALWLAISCFITPCFGATDTITVGGLQVAVWLPYQAPGVRRKWPVILFSHGLHSCGTQSTFLMEALANAGYAVFAPNHDDATCGNLAKWLQRPQASFLHPDQWSDGTYSNRRKDLEALLDALPKNPRFSELDWQHVGLAGHS